MEREGRIFGPSTCRFQVMVAELLRLWSVPTEAALAPEQPELWFSFLSVCTSRYELQAAIVTLR